MRRMPLSWRSVFARHATEAGLTQEQVADWLAVSPPSYRRDEGQLVV